MFSLALDGARSEKDTNNLYLPPILPTVSFNHANWSNSNLKINYEKIFNQWTARRHPEALTESIIIITTIIQLSRQEWTMNVIPDTLAVEKIKEKKKNINVEFDVLYSCCLWKWKFQQLSETVILGPDRWRHSVCLGAK